MLPAELDLYLERKAMIIALVYQIVKIRQEKCVLLEANGKFIMAEGKEQGTGIEIETTEHFATIMTTMIILIALVELIVDCKSKKV